MFNFLKKKKSNITEESEPKAKTPAATEKSAKHSEENRFTLSELDASDPLDKKLFAYVREHIAEFAVANA